MRKKILAALLALCMVIGLLPITALAAELTEAQKQALKDQGYTDEEIANVMVIDEDTELTEDFNGLVVVVGSVNVTVKGANIGVGLVVAPGATGAKIVLGENAVVNAVVALEKSDITVSETAQANSVTAVAAETVLTVDGTVSNVGAAATAEKVTINVTAKATVSSLTVAAPNAAANIAGTVASVSVEATAEGTALTVAETGNVTTASVAAPNTAVTVDGTVSTVDVAETATGAQVGGANADKVEVTGASNNVTTSTDNGTVEVGAGGTIEVGDNHLPIPDVKAAPLGEKSKGNIVYAPGYNVNVAKNNDHDKLFDVTIVGTIPKHVSSNTNAVGETAQGFVGLAIPLPTKTTTNAAGETTVQKTMEYSYYVIKTVETTIYNEDGTVLDTHTTTTVAYMSKEANGFVDNADVKGSEMLAQGIADASLYALYDTIYFTQSFIDKCTTGTAGTTTATIGGEQKTLNTKDKTTSYEIVVVDEKNVVGVAEDEQHKESTAVASDGLAAVGSKAVDDAIEKGLIDPIPTTSMNTWTAAQVANYAKAQEIALEAQKKAVTDAAEMILNLKIDVDVKDAEFITVDQNDGDTKDKVIVETAMPTGSNAPTNSHNVITAPKGDTEKDKVVTPATSSSPAVTENVPSTGATNAAKPSTPSAVPSYVPTLPSANP